MKRNKKKSQIDAEEANGEILKAITKDGVQKIFHHLKFSFYLLKSRLQIITLQIVSFARLILNNKDNSQSSILLFASSIELLLEVSFYPFSVDGGDNGDDDDDGEDN